MKTVKPILFFFFILVRFVFSQNSESSQLGNTSSYINSSPLSLADVYFPRLRVGYIQHLSGRWKMGLDIGYGSKGMGFGRDLGESYQLLEIRPELYRIFKPEAKTVKYLSAEFFYIKQNNVFVASDYDRDDGRQFRYSRADYNRLKYGMHLKFGLFLDIGKNLGFNFFGGIGVRYKKTEFANVINPVETETSREWYTPPQFDEGEKFGFNPSLGFRFYYKL